MIDQTKLVHEVLTTLTSTVYHPSDIDPLEYKWYAVSGDNNKQEGVYLIHDDLIWVGLADAYESKQRQ